MTLHELIKHVLSRLNTRAASMLCAFVLIGGGIYMCFAGLSAAGSIDLKAVFVEGKIQTGSLGLLAMFLGVVIVLALNHHRYPYLGEEIKLVINGNEIVGKHLSYRKMRELVQVAIASSVEARGGQPPNEALQPTVQPLTRPDGG